MKQFRFSASLVMGVGMLLTACASMTVDSAWRDPTYEGPPFAKVLVIGWENRPSVRHTIEDVFVGQLSSRGIAAVASYTLLPDPRNVKRAAVLEAAKESGAGGVLVVRPTGIETEIQNEPIADFYLNDANDMFVGMYGPPVTVRMQSQTVDTLTNFFDAKTGKMVWWGRASAPRANATSLSRQLSRTVISALKSAGLL